jgi:prophage DNA circulation protein
MTQEARYTSPGGKEITFGWETAKRDTELKTGVFTFPGKDGANVQHQGAGARTFPLKCIFSGADYTAKADEFEAMLIERGVAELQHPVYGTIKVKPVGHIEREDDPVNRLGESTVSVTFTETLAGEAAAELNEVAAADIDEKYEEFSEAAAADFAAAIEDAGAAEQPDIITALETQTQSITESMEPLAASDKKGFAEWLASAKELKDTIKKLYSKAKGITAKAESVYTKALTNIYKSISP